jgi:hypothetical protein
VSVCVACREEMQDATTCELRTLVIDGHSLKRVAYGEEAEWVTADRPCDDCAVKPGGIHHYLCDMERCPNCGGQLIGCGCRPDALIPAGP